ncbi:prisilkin-39-like isoform X1 [Pomacea canaliculata]|uniref:prisilkin-39-like isoform X1 n=1 Tax=Pomacea canaliculata TaxID=400727 RepID=UPI000D734092|nr:prisilkin-39-like isoform X1 [Pomacea canaliculata]
MDLHHPHTARHLHHLRYNVSIEAHPSCAWDKLTFDDDYNNLICGTLAGQRTYQVPDSDFVVRFASDSSVQGPGFQISYVITNSSGSTGFGNFSTTYQPSYNSSYQPVYNSTTGYPYYTNSTGYPYYTNSTGYPYYTYSTGYPYYTNSTSYPYYTYSTGYPYYTNSTSYPYYTNSTGYPYYTNSTGYPYYTNSTGYPYYTNSTGYPYYTNSTGYPYYTNSTGYPYNTTDQGYSFLTRDFWGPSGSFQSLNYPSYYPDNAQWTYTIHTQPGTFITLRYNVSIEANSFCSYDKLHLMTTIII